MSPAPGAYVSRHWLRDDAMAAWRMGGLAQMLGSAGLLRRSVRQLDIAGIKRFNGMVERMPLAIDKRRRKGPFQTDRYRSSVADIACYAWTITATTLPQDPVRDRLVAVVERQTRTLSP